MSFNTRHSGAFALSLSFIATLSCLALTGAAHGQDINRGIAGPTITGVTEPMPLGDHGVMRLAPASQKLLKRRIPIGEKALDEIKAESARTPKRALLNQGEDAETQSVERQAPTRLAVTKRCAGNASTGFTPSDIHGAVGPTNFVITTNVNITIRNKTTCGLISNQGLVGFFASVGVPSGTTIFDPRALYDTLSGRFFVTAESLNDTNDDQYQYFAVSTDSTGTSWHKYRIILSEGATLFCKQATTSFWDYPQAGVNSKRWLISANDFGTSVPGQLLSIDKAPTLTGAPTTPRCFQNNPPNLSVPVVLNGYLTAILLSPGSGAGSNIARLDYVTNATNHANDAIIARPSFTIPAWTAPANAPQPNGQLIDTLDGRFVAQSTQIGRFIWNVHSVNGGGHSLVRAYRLRAASNTVSTVLRTRDFCGVGSCVDDAHNASIATSIGPANTTKLFITFSRQIRSGVGFSAAAGRIKHMMMVGTANLAGPFPRNVISGSSSEYTNCGSQCRWGDYSSTQVDPSDPTTGWGFNQVIVGPSQFTDWRTRAGSVQ